MDFSKNGKTIFINKIPSESYDEFYDRGWFIVSNLEMASFEELSNMSKMMVWMQKGCKYSDDVTKKIIALKKNMWKIE